MRWGQHLFIVRVVAGEHLGVRGARPGLMCLGSAILTKFAHTNEVVQGPQVATIRAWQSFKAPNPPGSIVKLLERHSSGVQLNQVTSGSTNQGTRCPIVQSFWRGDHWGGTSNSLEGRTRLSPNFSCCQCGRALLWALWNNISQAPLV